MWNWNSTNLTFLAPDGYFSVFKNFAQKYTTYYSSLKFDSDAEFSAKNDTLQVNYGSPDCLSCYSVTIPRTDSSAMMPNFIHDSIST